jgi:tRNA(Ile)-lysidine synthase
LITEWRRLGLPFSGETIVAAVSGGADSVSLLLALDDLRKREKLWNRFVVAHFDHRLRGDSSASDRDFVRQLTADHGFELKLGEWSPPKQGNLEQNARNGRYEFLLKTAESVGARYVMTAHTMSDQAETVLMNLIRGSGGAGLGGMRPIRSLHLELGGRAEKDTEGDPLLPFPDPTVTLVRPFLKWVKRRDTEAFCREKNVEFRIDPMNEDLTFTRVWIRKVLLPLIEEVNPKIVDTLCRTAELLQAPSDPGPVGTGPDPASQQAVAGSDDHMEDGRELSLNAVKSLPQAALFRTLRSWLREQRGNLRGLELKHIEAVERLIHSPKSGKTVELPGGQAVVKHGGRLRFDKIKVEK